MRELPVRTEATGAYGRWLALVARALPAAVLLVLPACAAATDENEERPPIIVRGGSLIIESGARWFADGTDVWKLDQPKGRPTRTYDVSFEPPSCTGGPMPEFTVVYDPDDGGPEPEQRFTITRLPRAPGNRGTDAPAVRGRGLAASTTGGERTLTFQAASNTIVRVERLGGGTLCTYPTRITAVPRP